MIGARSALLAATNSGGPPGFGVKYANPATSPAGNGIGVAFSPSGDAIAVAHYLKPNITAYSWSSAGFGSKYANPAVLPTNQNDWRAGSVKWSPSGNVIIVGLYPGVAYQWSSVSGFGTRLNDPSNSSVNQRGMTFNPAGDCIAFTGDRTLEIWRWTDATGFGTKFSQPSVTPLNNTYDIAFSPSGDAVVMVSRDEPYVDAYTFSSITGIGTRYSNPTSSLDSRQDGVRFAPSGSIILFSGGSTGLRAYNWSTASGFGSRRTDANLGTFQANKIEFSPTLNVIGCTLTASPFIVVIPWTGSAFGAKYSNPAPVPSVITAWGLAFTPSGNAIAFAHQASPFITAYAWND